MEVIPEPAEGSAAILAPTNPLFVTENPYVIMSGGYGDTDYICGACKAVLAWKINRGQLSRLVLRCPSCKSFNVVRGS